MAEHLERVYRVNIPIAVHVTLWNTGVGPGDGGGVGLAVWLAVVVGVGVGDGVGVGVGVGLGVGEGVSTGVGEGVDVAVVDAVQFRVPLSQGGEGDTRRSVPSACWSALNVPEKGNVVDVLVNWWFVMGSCVTGKLAVVVSQSRSLPPPVLPAHIAHAVRGKAPGGSR